MTDEEVRRILDSVDEALAVYTRNRSVLTPAEIKLKSMLMLVRSVIANEMSALPVDAASE